MFNIFKSNNNSGKNELAIEPEISEETLRDYGNNEPVYNVANHVNIPLFTKPSKNNNDEF